MGKNIRNPDKKRMVSTGILALLWLLTSCFNVFFLAGRIRSLNAREDKPPVPITAHNSAIDNVTNLIEIDLNDNVIKEDTSIFEIHQAPYHNTYTESRITACKTALVLSCAYIICGIAMFIVFRNTKWLPAVYFVWTLINVAISLILALF